MFSRILRKKRVFVGAIVATLALAGGAFAYFTSTGSGTGTATVGSASPITLAGTITGELYPAGAPAEVSVLVTNSGKGSQYVNKVHLKEITTDVAHEGCNLSVSGGNPAFTMADIPVEATLAKEVGSKTVTGSLQMNDTGESQNACEGAPLTLHFTSN
jgi:hypothetical protein